MIKLGTENFIPNGIKEVRLGSDIIFQKEQIIPFTSNPAPTSWSGGSTTANSEWSGSNTYGTWKCYMTKTANGSTYTTEKAFDNSSTSYASGDSTGDNYIYLTLPNNISINPTNITFTLQYCANNTQVLQLKNAQTGEWETFYTISGGAIGSKTTENVTISNNNYYNEFRIHLNHGTTKPRLYEFSITSGNIKIN